MPLKLKPKTADATIEKVDVNNKDKTEDATVDKEKVEVPGGGQPVVKQLAEFEYSAGYTHNLGNYQSVRYNIGLKVPCEVEEVEATAEFVTDWVDKRLQGIIDGLQEG